MADKSKIEEINKLGVELKSIAKDTKEYQDVISEIVEKAHELADFDELRDEQLKGYILGLKEVDDLWDTLQEYISENLSLVSGFGSEVRTIRDLTSDIVEGMSTVGYQINQTIKPFREIRNLAGEFQRATEIEGGLQEKAVSRLDRRIYKQTEEALYQAQRIAGISEEINLRQALIQGDQEVLGILDQARDLEMQRAVALQRRLALEEDLSGKERAHLEQQIRLHQAKAEAVDRTNLSTILGLQKASDIRKDIESQMRTQTFLSGMATGFLGKLGVPGIAEEYEGYVSRGVAAKEDAVKQRRIYEEAESTNAVESRNIDANIEAATRVKSDSQSKIQEILDAHGGVDPREEIKSEQDKLASLEAALQSYEKERDRIFYGIQFQDTVPAETEARYAKLETEILPNLVEQYNRQKAAIDDLKRGRAEEIEQLVGLEKAIKQSDVKISSEEARRVDLQESVVRAKEASVKADALSAKYSEGNLGVVKSIGANLVKNLAPATLAVDLALRLWKAFQAVNLDAAELKRRVGSWEIGTAAVNHELATSVDWLKTATDLADFTGLNSIRLFDDKQIAQAAEFKNLTGASVQAANNLLTRSKLLGKSTDDYRKALTAGANEGNRLNRSVVNLREVQNGVLEASDATALSYGNNARELGRAVVAAKNLGMELAGIERISDSLLNFESSIANEMEAQLLTGMQLNLHKAREFALNNDLEGVATEIQRQGVTAARFQQMNRIQQEGIAKALGMSREELAKSLILRELNNGASAQALAAATNMTKEQIEAISLQDRWRITTEKLVQALTPILELLLNILTPISKAIAYVSQLIGYISSAVGWLTRLGGLLDGEANIHDVGGGTLIPNIRHSNKGGDVAELRQRRAREARFENTENVQKLDGQIQALEASMTGLGAQSEQTTNVILGGTKKALGALPGLLAMSVAVSKSFPRIGAAFGTAMTSIVRGAGTATRTVVDLFVKTSAGIKSLFSKDFWVGLAGKVKGLPKQLFGRAKATFMKGFNSREAASTALDSKKLGSIKNLTRNAAAVPEVTSTGKGLSTLGNNVKRFIQKFKTISNADIVKATSAMATIRQVKGTTILFVGKNLPTLARNVVRFFTRFKSVSNADITKGSIALRTLQTFSLFAVPIAILAALGPVASRLPSVGRGIAGFFRALGKSGGGMVSGATSLSAAMIALVPAIAIFTVAAIGLGFALRLLAPTVEAFGTVITAVFSGIATLMLAASVAVGSTIGSIVAAVKQLSVKEIGKIALLGLAFGSFGLSVMSAVPSLVLFGVSGLPVLWMLGKAIQTISVGVPSFKELKTGLSGLSPIVGEVKALVEALRDLGDSLENLSVRKIKAIGSIGSINIGTPTVSGSIESQEIKGEQVAGKSIEATASKVEEVKRLSQEKRSSQEKEVKDAPVDLVKVEQLLNTIVQKLGEGQNIYMDSVKVGHTLAWATSKM